MSLDQRMILQVIFLIFCVVAIISQITRWQKLDNDAERAQSPEEKAAFKKAQTKMIPNLGCLIIGAIIAIIAILMYLTAPTS